MTMQTINFHTITSSLIIALIKYVTKFSFTTCPETYWLL